MTRPASTLSGRVHFTAAARDRAVAWASGGNVERRSRGETELATSSAPWHPWPMNQLTKVALLLGVFFLGCAAERLVVPPASGHLAHALGVRLQGSVSRGRQQRGQPVRHPRLGTRGCREHQQADDFGAAFPPGSSRMNGARELHAQLQRVVEVSSPES
jgi:hypothetical protein